MASLPKVDREGGRSSGKITIPSRAFALQIRQQLAHPEAPKRVSMQPSVAACDIGFDQILVYC
jgi:hypothetical protein